MSVTPGRSARLVYDDFVGRRSADVLVVAETPERYRIATVGDKPVKLAGRDRWLEPGKTALVPKRAIEFGVSYSDAELHARGADFRFGRWQDVLADVECDAAIFDAPYGERTHKGHDAGTKQRNQLLCSSALELGYEFLTPADVEQIVEHWEPRTRGWFCTMTCDDLAPVWKAALARSGRYVFPTLPVLEFYRPRLLGDGPGMDAVFMIVARPKSRAFLARKWGSLPGHYKRHEGEGRASRMGGKTLGVMRDIVGDYTRPGELVCDMFAGVCTTGRAALELGRRFVGCERHQPTWAAGRTRLLEPLAVEMFADAGKSAPEQFELSWCAEKHA